MTSHTAYFCLHSTESYELQGHTIHKIPYTTHISPIQDGTTLVISFQKTLHRSRKLSTNNLRVSK